MPNLTVAVLGPVDYAKDLGKKGTTSDITFYNLKRGDVTVTFIEPTRYPEKIAPLFYAVSMAHEALMVVDEVNAAFGETLLMLQCIGLAKGRLILRNYLTRDQLLPLIRGTVLEQYEVFTEEPGALREVLLGEASAMGAPAGTAGPGTVPIDHFFNVKGIGTVILGGVMGGTIRKHDMVQVLPIKKPVQVRSIQKHDDDADMAETGDRVGLSLKGIEADELDRGYVLTSDPTIQVSEILSGKTDLVKYWNIPLKQGMVVHVGHWMQFVPGRIESVTGAGTGSLQLAIRMDKEIVHPPGAKVVLHYLEGGKLRVMGTLNLP